MTAKHSNTFSPARKLSYTASNVKGSGAYYDGKYEQMARAGSVLLPPRYRLIMRALGTMKPGKLLDVGCGEGSLSEGARELGFDVVGVEHSMRAIEICQAKRLTVYALDVEAEPLPFRAEFDVAVAAEIIEHLRDPYHFLAALNRALKPQGWLFVSMPNSGWIVWRLCALFGRTVTELQNPLHLRFFTMRSLRRICRLQGFAVERDLSYLPLPYVHRWGGSRFLRLPAPWAGLWAETLLLQLKKTADPVHDDLRTVVADWRKNMFAREARWFGEM